MFWLDYIKECQFSVTLRWILLQMTTNLYLQFHVSQKEFVVFLIIFVASLKAVSEFRDLLR